MINPFKGSSIIIPFYSYIYTCYLIKNKLYLNDERYLCMIRNAIDNVVYMRQFVYYFTLCYATT